MSKSVITMAATLVAVLSGVLAAGPTEGGEMGMEEATSIYTRLCTTCHGKDGKAQTDMADNLIVKPTNFTLGVYRYGDTTGELFSVIKNGTPNGMAAYGSMLDDEKIHQLVRYVRGFSSIDEASARNSPPVAENPVKFDVSSVRRGKQLFARHCALCHGKDGRGDTQMREFLKTHPANLIDDRWIYGGRDGDIFDVIKNGRTDRDMEAFADRLSDERIWHVVNYLRYLGGKRL